jgi:uncharacterized delta-60 repeat protein
MIRMVIFKFRSIGIPLALTLAILLASIGAMRPAQANAGDLDPAFGSGGKVITDMGGFARIHALTIQNDGKIIAAGTNGNAFALARYNVDGSLDTDFSGDGKVITEFSLPTGDFVQAFAVILQPDGKIVAGGVGFPGFTGPDFALVRYHPDGSLDKTFGKKGKVFTNFLSFNSREEISALAIQPDGKIVAAGNTSSPIFILNQVFGLARYNVDGSLDTTFGTGGKTTLSFFDNSSTNEVARVIALRPDGKIVVAGFASSDFGIARFNNDGSLDTNFGTGGKVITDFGGQEEVLAIALKPDGNIFVAGRSTQTVSNEKLALARYNADGVLDARFGVGGKLLVDFFMVGSGLSGDGLNAVMFQDDGKIVAGGYGNVNQSGFLNDFGIARYNDDGTLDPSFGLNGKVSTDFGGMQEGIFAVAVQLDGKLVTAGQTGAGDFALGRYDVPALPDFALGFNATQVTAQRGEKTSIVVNVNRIGGFNGRVTVTPPDGSAIKIKMIPSDPISTSEAKVTFKAKVKGSAPTGPHELNFIGSDDSGRTRSAKLTLQIQ